MTHNDNQNPVRRPLELPVFPVPEKAESRWRFWIRSAIIAAGAYDENHVLRGDDFFRSMCYLCYLAFDGARRIYGKDLPEAVRDRLTRELTVISRAAVADLFLIVQEFVDWARSNGIPVGPGRGNTPGSLVAYCIGITRVDPLQHGLLFERFFNPSCDPIPDIDVDVAAGGRMLVIDHLLEKYGPDHVALVEAYRFGPGGEILQKAVHAYSVVLGRKPLSEYLPLTTWTDPATGLTYPVSRCNSADAAQAGVLQLDIIGQEVLDHIRDCVALVAERHHVTIVPDKVPGDDAETFALYSRGDTDGVFHFEGSAKGAVLRRFKPDRIEDLMLLDSLFRPHGAKWIFWVVAQRQGGASLASLPEAEDILAETYGMAIYQEQVMRIAQRIAEFSPEHSDRLRRALCRMDGSALAELYADFLLGAGRKGYRPEDLEPLWETWEAHGRMIFSKSHAAAYAMLSYQTAWLKTHYPAEYAETD